MPARPRRDAGYVTVFTLGVSMALVSVVGLVLDGGRAQRAQGDAFGAAAAASRAGAQQLDPLAAVNGEVRLDPALAEAMNIAAIDFPPEISDVELAGFERLPGEAVAPGRIAQSPVAAVRSSSAPMGGLSPTLPRLMRGAGRGRRPPFSCAGLPATASTATRRTLRNATSAGQGPDGHRTPPDGA